MKINNLSEHVGEIVFISLNCEIGNENESRTLYFTTEEEAREDANHIHENLLEMDRTKTRKIGFCVGIVLADETVWLIEDLETEIIEAEEPSMFDDIENAAASLFDGGWRREDKEWMMSEYDLTEEDAERICVEFDRIEETTN